MIESLPSIFDRPWKPVARPVVVAWLLFYAGFLFYALSAHGRFLFIDSANLVVHEGGHNLFGWFGPTLGLWGGTLLQWLVPFLLAAYFFNQRQISGFVFCAFFFFENWLYTATYMADARDQALPLVTTGDPDFVEHDWFQIFSSLGVLNSDTKIAAVVRALGWCGMIVVTVWFAIKAMDAKFSEALPVPMNFPKPAVPLVERYSGKAKLATSASVSTSTAESQTAPPTAPSPQ